MKYTCLALLLHLTCIPVFSQQTKPASQYLVPDSIPAMGFYAELSIPEFGNSKKAVSGISANEASVSIGSYKRQKNIQFRFRNKKSKNLLTGNEVYNMPGAKGWNYNWSYNEIYPLLVLSASDSASHSTHYSGYIFLPKENKWKLIASSVYPDTMRIQYAWPGASNRGGEVGAVIYSNRWLLRSNGTWKALDSQTVKPPSLRPMRNIDSLYQQQLEEETLRARLPKDSVVYKEGIFYQSLQEGSGRPVNVTDTVVVFYKGTLFSDGSVFDQTKDKPASFPLSRLIKGWQLGLPHCRVGGKIRLYIPSGSAYGIRTFATRIPPNSTLVFDVEVVEVKERTAK